MDNQLSLFGFDAPEPKNDKKKSAGGKSKAKNKADENDLFGMYTEETSPEIIDNELFLVEDQTLVEDAVAPENAVDTPEIPKEEVELPTEKDSIKDTVVADEVASAEEVHTSIISQGVEKEELATLSVEESQLEETEAVTEEEDEQAPITTASIEAEIPDVFLDSDLSEEVPETDLFTAPLVDTSLLDEVDYASVEAEIESLANAYTNDAALEDQEDSMVENTTDEISETEIIDGLEDIENESIVTDVVADEAIETTEEPSEVNSFAEEIDAEIESTEPIIDDLEEDDEIIEDEISEEEIDLDMATTSSFEEAFRAESDDDFEEDSEDAPLEEDVISLQDIQLNTVHKRGRKSFKEIDSDVELVQIPKDDVLFQKQYYTISEVADWFRVNNSLLRFWENEFDILKPRKTRKGDRLFRPEDVKNLQVIYYLLRQKKYTIDGARKYLKANRKTVDVNIRLIQTLKDFKSFLLELKLHT